MGQGPHSPQGPAEGGSPAPRDHPSRGKGSAVAAAMPMQSTPGSLQGTPQCQGTQWGLEHPWGHPCQPAPTGSGEREDRQPPPGMGKDTSLVFLAGAQAGRSGGQEEGRAAEAAEGQELGAQRVEDVGEEEEPPDIFRGLVGEGRAGVQRGAHVGELSLGTQGRGWYGWVRAGPVQPTRHQRVFHRSTPRMSYL